MQSSNSKKIFSEKEKYTECNGYKPDVSIGD